MNFNAEILKILNYDAAFIEDGKVVISKRQNDLVEKIRRARKEGDLVTKIRKQRSGKKSADSTEKKNLVDSIRKQKRPIMPFAMFKPILLYSDGEVPDKALYHAAEGIEEFLEMNGIKGMLPINIEGYSKSRDDFMNDAFNNERRQYNAKIIIHNIIESDQYKQRPHYPVFLVSKGDMYHSGRRDLNRVFGAASEGISSKTDCFKKGIVLNIFCVGLGKETIKMLAIHEAGHLFAMLPHCYAPGPPEVCGMKLVNLVSELEAQARAYTRTGKAFCDKHLREAKKRISEFYLTPKDSLPEIIKVHDSILARDPQITRIVNSSKLSQLEVRYAAK